MKDKINVAIIGGGLSGLLTAYLLKHKLALEHKTIDLTLFEATDRIGGRIYTLRNFHEELYAELGAISIGDNEEDILQLAKELNLKLAKRSDRQHKRFFSEGRWQTQSDITTIISFIMQELDTLQQTGIITKEMDWVSTDPCKEGVLNYLDTITLIDFLQKAIEEHRLALKYPNKLYIHVAAGLLGHYAHDVATLSAFDAMRFMSQYQQTTSVYSIVDGNDVLTTTLYKKIANTCNVMFNAPVSQIIRNEYNKLLITIHCHDEKKLLEFDYAVLAVPLTGLQIHNDHRINFKPPLPQYKSNAINKIPYNQRVARVYFEVESKFWLQENPYTAMTITDKTTSWIEDHTAHLKNKNHAVLEAHTGGIVGQKIIESKNPEDLGKKEITSVYGDAFKKACSNQQPVTFFWSKQKYQQGAYPNLLPGQRKYIEALGKTVGTMFFAGEYTSVGHPASMNGAVRSAFRVFNELTQSIQTNRSEVEFSLLSAKL